jgi:proteasome lid subunit RPN8/RPN11
MSVLPLLTAELRAQLLAHAQAEAPRECCGLLVRGASLLHYLPARNLAAGDAARDSFTLDPQAWVQAEELGEPVAVVHSHPGYSANPSMADRTMCERSALPWLIVGLPSGTVVELLPSQWQAPLRGREFHFGVLDCYTLVQDHYRVELGITLPDFPRTEGFWERGEHLYRDGLEAAGFVVVQGEPQPHDGLLMRVMSTDVDNHAAVYLGDGYMLHHLHGQLSREERWDWAWQRRTTAVVRHRSRMGGPA